MVEGATVTRRTLKGLTKEARRVDRVERKAARGLLKAHGYGALDALNPDAHAPSELYQGHEWTLEHVGTAGHRSTVTVSYDVGRAAIGINTTDRQTRVEIPLRTPKKPSGGAVEINGKSKPLTEATAQSTKKILQELATSKR